jgi:hypothetical protein
MNGGKRTSPEGGDDGLSLISFMEPQSRSVLNGWWYPHQYVDEPILEQLESECVEEGRQ